MTRSSSFFNRLPEPFFFPKRSWYFGATWSLPGGLVILYPSFTKRRSCEQVCCTFLHRVTACPSNKSARFASHYVLYRTAIDVKNCEEIHVSKYSRILILCFNSLGFWYFDKPVVDKFIIKSDDVSFNLLERRWQSNAVLYFVSSKI